jgi:hypothetical protein
MQLVSNQELVQFFLAGKIDAYGTLNANVQYKLTKKFFCNVNAKVILCSV